jgi:nicotinamidase-related amidase
MSLDALDPHTALIVVDLQKGTVRNPLVHPVEEVVAHGVELLAAFRRHGLPVVLVNGNGPPPGRTEYSHRELPVDWSELIPEVDPQTGELTVTKTGWGAFTGTGLHDRLGALGVTQVVIAGLATSFGVESTARAAYDHGYNVVLVVDAMSDVSMDSHENSLTRVYPALGQLSTTDQVIALLDLRG